jgi:hypothetical protein
VPVFVGLNFSGNQANTPDMDVRMTRGMYMNKERKVVPFTDKYRGNRLDSWNFIEAMKRGYAVATACYWEICPDYMTGVKISPFTLFYDEKDLRMDFEVPFAELRGLKWQRPVSIIGAWAWGLSRMLDALEREPLVDSKRAAVVGHSRLGKTALWAGACDERFKLVISNTDFTRTGHGLYTDDRSDGSPCAKVGFTFSVGGDMERRRLAGMKPASLSPSPKNQKVQKNSQK